MASAVNGIRRSLVALILCLMVSLADPSTQSKPPAVSDSLFAAAPVVNAPFIADAVTTLFPASDASAKAIQTERDRYYRDSAGRVRAERRRGKGGLIIIDTDPGDGRVALLKPEARTFAPASVVLAQHLFHSASDVTSPRFVFNRGILGGDLVAREVSPDLGLVVYARHVYPRVGTVEFRLTNIRQEEPAPELFEIPETYLPAPAGTTFTLLPPDGDLQWK